MESESQFSEFEFWKSPIPKVDASKGEKSSEGVHGLPLEDVKVSPTKCECGDSDGSGQKEDKSVKEELKLGKDGLKKTDVQSQLNFDEMTDVHQAVEEGSKAEGEGASGSQVEGQDKVTENCKESKEKEQIQGSQKESEKSTSLAESTSVQDGDTSKAKCNSEPLVEGGGTDTASTTSDNKIAEKSSESVSTGSVTGEAGSSTASTNPSSSEKSGAAKPSAEGQPRGTDVAVTMEDVMRMRSCSAGSSLRSELGSNLVFGEDKKGQGETKKRRWSLDKMNKLRENNSLPPVSDGCGCVEGVGVRVCSGLNVYASTFCCISYVHTFVYVYSRHCLHVYHLLRDFLVKFVSRCIDIRYVQNRDAPL